MCAVVPYVRDRFMTAYIAFHNLLKEYMIKNLGSTEVPFGLVCACTFVPSVIEFKSCLT